MKICVVGGGLFGVTAAIKLAEAGHTVDLFEKESDIMKAASGINQFRLHSGYHYPRSQETISSCIAAKSSFLKEYGDAVINDVEHYYCIAKEKSLTSGSEYLNILKENQLKFEEETPHIVNEDLIDVCVRVDEKIIDPIKLKKICKERLEKSDVKVRLNTPITKEYADQYDLVVVATYSNLNPALEEIGASEAKQQYQHELCEKIVVKLPREFNDKSVVIMDGPFTCVDPYGSTGHFLMGNVVHAIHRTTVGETLIPDKAFKPLLNNGIIKNPQITNFDKFIKAAEVFMPGIKDAEHIGSMFTIRTVLPNRDDTDTRPTIFEVLDDRVVKVFSGKLGNSVDVANDLVSFAKGRTQSSV